MNSTSNESTTTTSDTTLSAGESTVRLRWDAQFLQVRLLDECFFVSECGNLDSAAGSVQSGLLISDYDDEIPVQFQIAGAHKGLARGNFCGLAQSSSAEIRKLLDKLKPLQTNALSHRKSPTKAPPIIHSEAASANSRSAIDIARQIPVMGKMAIAALAFMCAVGYVSAHVPHVIQANGGLVEGQRMTVSVPESGHLTQLLVAVGDSVEAGDVLAQISRSSQPENFELVVTELERSEQELKLFVEEQKQATKSVALAKQQIADELTAVREKLATVKQRLASNEELLQRWAPLIANDNIPTREVEDLKNKIANLKSDRDKHEADASRLQQAKSLAAKNILMKGDIEFDPIADASQRVAVVAATVKRLKRQRDTAVEVAAKTDVISENKGVVQAIHAKADHLLQAEDAAIELSVGDTWVVGYVHQQHRDELQPGQVAEIAVPSRGVVLTGKIHDVGKNAHTEIAKSDSDVVPIRLKLDPQNAPIQLGEKVQIGIRTNNKLRHWVTSIFGGSSV